MNEDTNVAKNADTHVRLPGGDDPHTAMHQMIFSASLVQITRCAAIFSFADHFSKGPSTAESMALAEGLNVDATYRLMRACASFGLLTSTDMLTFSTTPLLDTLAKENPASLRDLAIMQGGPGHWKPWGKLDDAIRTGKTQTEATLGYPGIFEYYGSADGAQEAVSNSRAMASVTQLVDKEAARKLDIRNAAMAADIGGAGGSLVRAILHANPTLQGVLLDLPHVVLVSAELAENLELKERLTVVGGNFFKEVPKADLYLLRHILHDWTDEECVAILRNCRNAAESGARLVIIELLMDDGIPQPFVSQVDLTMLAAVGGRERTLEEYKRLLEESGFEYAGMTKVTPIYTMIEAVSL